MVEIILFCFRF